MSKEIDWVQIDLIQSNMDADSSALEMLYQKVEAIREELLTNLPQ